MHDVFDGVKRTFWNPDEKRLRALFRVPATAGLLLLVVSLVLPLVAVLNRFAGLPDIFPQVLSFALVTLGLVALTWFIDRRRVRDFGLGVDRQWGLDLIAGFTVGALMAAVAVTVLLAAGFASVESTYTVENPDFIFGADSTAVGIIYGFFFFGVFAVLEEIIVRGYLLVNIAEGLRRPANTDRRAVLWAVAFTAVLFGVVHAANPGGTLFGLVNITVAGVFFGLSYAVTDRLAFPIGVHVTWNFTTGSVFGLPVSGLRTDAALLGVTTDGPSLLTGGEFGPEGGVVMLLGLAVGIGVFVVWVRRQYGEVSVNERIAVPDLWVTDDAED